MKIIADTNIPRVEDAFGGLGEVMTMPGRHISRRDVADADVLLVRSVTRVNEELLSGSKVRFVGTATIGTDHVDEEYLAGEGIRFAAAPGSNSNSVAEYITAAILRLACRRGEPLAGRSIGVIGVGNVGARVAGKAAALGMRVVGNDPPLARSSGDPAFRPLEEALECDYVTLHVPLEEGGDDPTLHMVDESFLNSMQRHAVLLNSSRGAVVKESALKSALEGGCIGGAVLDVWENEPDIDARMVELADLATPHIAGYSLDGKFEGVRMLYEALCEFLDMAPQVDVDALKPEPEISELVFDCEGEMRSCLHNSIRKVYDIERDDARLRDMISLREAERPGYFDSLRKDYPVRREFFTVRAVAGKAGCGRWREVRGILRGLGFDVEG